VEARARSERKVFSAKGQPQWRRKVMTVGFLFEAGRASFVHEGALLLSFGAGDIVGDVGGSQELNSWRKVIVWLGRDALG